VSSHRGSNAAASSALASNTLESKVAAGSTGAGNREASNTAVQRSDGSRIGRFLDFFPVDLSNRKWLHYPIDVWFSAFS